MLLERLRPVTRLVDTVRVVNIRPETPADYEAIAGVVTAAASANDARLVELIRASDNYDPALALVAESESAIVGHILFSYVELRGQRTTRVLALAPMAVGPTHQRTGIGSALVEAGLKKADALGGPLVLVLGHAGYYPRFGFEPARPLGIEPPFSDLPDDVWMIKRLSSYSERFRGTVSYPPAFDVA